MADRPPKILICSCEDTMPLDGAAVQRGCRGAELLTARQLCRAELEKFRAAAASGEPLVVGCTQEAPLFSELAGDTAVTYNDWTGVMTGPDGAKIEMAGKAIEVCRRQPDGTWRVAIDDPFARG
jgi:hypothetical protein